MRVNRGYTTDTTAGDRKIIFCEGGENSVDVIFYKTLLGNHANKFEFKPLGSSNTLLCYAKTELIKNGFCLIDRDFRTENEVSKLEKKYSIKFLKVHEIENYFLDKNYLSKLSYFRTGVDIDKKIEEIISSKRVRFLSDFLQFKINTHLDEFPRIPKLENKEIPEENEVINLLLSKLDNNYEEVRNKISEIENQLIQDWFKEYDDLTSELLPSKEIFKELKNKIFNNPPKENDIAKDLALLMQQNHYIPSTLEVIFEMDYKEQK